MKINLMLLFLSLLSFSSSVEAQAQSKKKLSPTQKIHQDIRQTLGIVPGFLKNYPEEGLAGAWQDMKHLRLNTKTALSGKEKEFIGLAVSAQIPCRYCVIFHKEAALLYGAGTEEILETLATSALVRRWSTILHGNQVGLAEFKREIDQLLDFVEKRRNTEAMESTPAQVPTEITTPKEAFEDMELQFGFVPNFMKNYPETAVVGAWKELKGLLLGEETKLTGKQKDLLGLSVSAQIPSPHLVYYHTRSALLQGASQQEIREAVAMAGAVREWSTVLNGLNQSEGKFKQEVKQMIQRLESKLPKEVGLDHNKEEVFPADLMHETGLLELQGEFGKVLS